MESAPDCIVVVVRGRVQELSPARRAAYPPFSGRSAWRAALFLFGGLSLLLAGWIAAGLGSVAAAGGVILFLSTAVTAGADRFELATAVGAAALLWTGAGISVALRVDSAGPLTAAGFLVVGVVALAAGAHVRLRSSRRSEPTPP